LTPPEPPHSFVSLLLTPERRSRQAFRRTSREIVDGCRPNPASDLANADLSSVQQRNLLSFVSDRWRPDTIGWR
jgi:hypothetical protein